MPLFFWLTSLLRLGQKYRNIFVRFLVQMKTLKFAFDIYWPLVCSVEDCFNFLWPFQNVRSNCDNFSVKQTAKVITQTLGIRGTRNQIWLDLFHSENLKNEFPVYIFSNSQLSSDENCSWWVDVAIWRKFKKLIIISIKSSLKTRQNATENNRQKFLKLFWSDLISFCLFILFISVLSFKKPC